VSYQAVTVAVLMFHLAVTSAMAGLIWFVQIVHYPLFAQIPEAAFGEYERLHMKRTGFVVGPLMVAELLTGLWLAYRFLHRSEVFLASLIFLAVAWLSTLFIQAPLHKRLSSGYDAALVRKLVATNWIRTLSWTARVGLLLWAIWR